jgi:phytoene synthase
MNRKLEDIFRKGSTTYFNTSLFFPNSVRRDIIALYAFVRTADDFVDETPADPQGFLQFSNLYKKGQQGIQTGDLVIDAFSDLSRKYQFNPQWAEAFLISMERDLYRSTYTTMQELKDYMYGSAEVIGLFMARILQLPEGAIPYAKMQGRAMQLINFIRDVQEDKRLGREYLPQENRREGLLSEYNAKEYPDEFKEYIRALITQYRQWQKEAEIGYSLIPTRYLIPIKTAADMYRWTADVIYSDPFLVFQQKVKPSKALILRKVFTNGVLLYLGRRDNAR